MSAMLLFPPDGRLSDYESQAGNRVHTQRISRLPENRPMPDLAPFSRRDVELVAKETPFHRFFRVDTYHLRHPLFEGGLSPVVQREVFERGQSACCLPYDPVRDEVVLIEQFRPGALAAGDPHPWLIEAPAGIVETGETPEDVVRREAVEEAGCAITDLEFVMNLYPSPGCTSERVAMYIGRTSSQGAGGIHGLDNEAEDIRVFTLPFDEAIRLVDEGKAQTSAGAILILWLALHRDALRAKWR